MAACLTVMMMMRRLADGLEHFGIWSASGKLTVFHFKTDSSHPDEGCGRHEMSISAHLITRDVLDTGHHDFSTDDMVIF